MYVQARFMVSSQEQESKGKYVVLPRLNALYLAALIALLMKLFFFRATLFIISSEAIVN